MAIEPRYMSTSTAASYLDITEKALRMMVWRGQIVPIRRGRRLMFDRLALHAWAAAHTQEPVVGVALAWTQVGESAGTHQLNVVK